MASVFLSVKLDYDGPYFKGMLGGWHGIIFVNYITELYSTHALLGCKMKREYSIWLVKFVKPSDLKY